MHQASLSCRRLRTVLGHITGCPSADSFLSAASCDSSTIAGIYPSQTQTLGFDAERLKRIDAFVQSVVTRGDAPMMAVGVLRHGKLAHLALAGHQDVERRTPLSHNTIYRMFSMTKAVVSAALLMLYEEGHFESFDAPVSKFLPCFADMRIFVSGGTPEKVVTRPAKIAITIKHLLLHTSGLAYGFVKDNAVICEMYNQSIDFGPQLSGDERKFQPWTLDEAVQRLAKLPLLSEPGEEWHYSHSTDVIGRLIEVLSGTSLAEFLRTRIFEPLGMQDTGFWVPEDKASRFAALYMNNTMYDLPKSADGRSYTLLDDPTRSMYLRQPTQLLSGGGGLVSTMSDWFKWANFLLRKGCTESGDSLLSPKTFDYASQNHLPGSADLEVVGANCSLHRNVIYRRGQGWTLNGFAVIQNEADYDAVCSKGELAWGSVASGYMWIDRKEDLAVILKTQLLSSAAYPWRRQLHGLVYQALHTLQ